MQHEGVHWSECALCCCAACNISLYYYAGFCYLLLRRYTDAARTFNIILNYISRWDPGSDPVLSPHAAFAHSSWWREARQSLI